MARGTDGSPPNEDIDKLPAEVRVAGWAREYAQDLRRFLIKRRVVESEINDVCQEVYLRLLRFERAEVLNNPQAYIYRVAANVAHDFKLRRAQWTEMEKESMDELPGEAGPEQLTEASLRARSLLRVMAALPPLPRAAVALQYQGSLTYAEIAERLNVSQRVVKRAIARSYALMREALQKDL